MVKNISITILFIILSLNIKGQVTIGSEFHPNQGAILDLKQENTIGSNSSKGLQLPRVNLVSEYNLFPMFASGYSKTTEDPKHIGLIVYNINGCFAEGQGPYSWNGNQWTLLIQRENAEILSFQDQEGNTFHARQFGNAGIWMTQNLAAKTYDPIRDKKGEPFYNNIKIRYPNNDAQLVVNYPWMGVLYDFKTATNGRSDADINNTNIHIQGICPSGWHVPSSEEWYILETEIINNTDMYTTLDYKYIDKGVNQPALLGGTNNQQYGDDFRPGLIDPCPMPNRNDNINGVSLKASEGGFAVRMVGVMKDTNNNGIFDVTDEYGTKAGFWVAHAPASGDGRNRVFLNTSIHNNKGNANRYYSVRCKKNE